MRKLISLVICFVAVATMAQAEKRYVGGDISILPLYEKSKTYYYDGNNRVIPDLVPWLVNECGWNSFRVRLFVNPQKKHPNGDSDPCVCQDINYVCTLGKRIKDAGASFMLDFHYSDTWVDAGHIQSPAAWKSLTVEQKAEMMYSYTRESLQALIAAGAEPDLVQVGNEIMYGLCDVKVHPYDATGDNWPGYISLLRNGCKAVREVCPNAKIIIHTDRPANQAYNKYYYKKLISGNVDFDIIGLSFYPFWHGWFTPHTSQYNNGLIAGLNQLALDFPDKKVQIVETAYNFQYWPTTGVNYNTQDTWECSIAGQHQFVKDLVEELDKHPNVNGIFYWCPEEAGNGDAANWTTGENIVMPAWLNRGLWASNKTGSAHKAHAVGGVVTAKLLGDYIVPIKGDVNGDGDVDIADVNCTINIILNLVSQSQYPGADINNDNVVDIADINGIINIILGLN